MGKISLKGYVSLAAAGLWLLIAVGYCATNADDPDGRLDRDAVRTSQEAPR